MLETIDIHYKNSQKPVLRITDIESYEITEEQLIIQTIEEYEIRIEMNIIQKWEIL